ncbi:unnamed protein product [Ilex paraguariensis]|uniref:Hydrophobic seed protein domain-containing protein n=1 Tax=Ilex paraguariensis TaxID=185542 RepID=A0ABC8S4R3_9AQUA
MTTKAHSSTTLFLFLSLLFFVIARGRAPSTNPASAPMASPTGNNSSPPMPSSAPPPASTSNNSTPPPASTSNNPTPPTSTSNNSTPPASPGSVLPPLMPSFAPPPPLMTPNCNCTIDPRRLAICSLPLYGVSHSAAQQACCLQLRLHSRADAYSCICKAINDKTALKLDNTGKAILTVLRHLGRITESRVGHHRVIILLRPQ